MQYKLACDSWDEKELEALDRVIKSRRFTMGEEVLAFEQEAAEYFRSKHCIMVNSGSSANLLMVAAMMFTSTNRWERGDTVIVPAVSWPTTYYPLHQYGLNLEFVDINKKSLGIEVDRLEEVFVSSGAKGLFGVHLLGQPIDLAGMCEWFGVTYLEDTCEAMGASLLDRRRDTIRYAGTFGKMGSFSMFYSHHISTMEGGFILTDDDELNEILRCLRAHGWTRNLPERSILAGARDQYSFYENFRFLLPGYNVRPLEMSAAVGRTQLKKLSTMNSQRLFNAVKIAKVITDIPYLEPIMYPEMEGVHAWFGFPLVLNERATKTRDELAEYLVSKGIECRPIVAGNFTTKEVMKHINPSIDPTKYPIAEYIDKNGLFVGNDGRDLTREIDYLGNVLSDWGKHDNIW